MWGHNRGRGFALMMLATVALTLMHALVRHLSSQLHPFEIAFFRNLFGLMALVPLLLRGGRISLVSHQPRLQLLRGLLGVTAMLSWFYALSVVPLAEATTISFTSVIFASLGAGIFLREPMRLRRWIAVCIGFSGVLIMLRPGFQSVDGGMLIALFASVCWGVAVVVVKQLSGTDSVVSIVAWMGIMLSVLSLPPALWVWQWPTPTQLAWLVLVGTLATAGHLMATRALQLADTTAVLPLDFMRLVWAGVIGYLVFSELPDFYTWLGGGTIVASASYILYRESARAAGRHAAEPPEIAPSHKQLRTPGNPT
jgi:drug/metabolite transporter (DMT)-like permease